MAGHSIFHDPTNRRWKRIKILAGVSAVVAAVMVAAFALSLADTPFLPLMPGITSELKRAVRRVVPRRRNAQLQFMARRDQERVLAAFVRDRDRFRARSAQPPVKAPRIVAAFYAPWQETGLHSLRANADRMTHLLPAWVHLQDDARGLDFHDWDNTLVPHNKDVLDIAREHNLNVVPVLSNAEIGESGSGEFDPRRTHALLTNVDAQNRIIFELRRWCLANHFQGINVDFENLDAGDYPLLIPFLQRLRASFAPAGLLVSADLEAGKPLNWKLASAACDFVVLMAYDEYGGGTTPGPIASIGWFRQTLVQALRSIPREKLVVGMANYAYDWMDGRGWAEPMTYQGALVTAKKFHPGEKPEDIVDFDPEFLNPTFEYIDDQSQHHEVWMLDGITAANQWTIAQSYGVRGVGIWVLGSTDPSIWTFFGRDRLAKPLDWQQLEKVVFPYDVEFVGEGEISHVDSLPHDGARSLELDPRSGLALDEQYHSFPTSYVISRTGYVPKTIALTIDDGPAAPYTAQMLDELKKRRIPATFFLIGQNSDRYPNLVRRIWDEGHEIGNHTFTHPNVGALSDERARLEINATQRVFQSLLHRSTLLFRPPYNADAEPTSAEEVKPIVIASDLNYITVLEFLDPQDWNLREPQPDGSVKVRRAEDMLQTLLSQLDGEKGSCILLHDGGGNRAETVRLIPMLYDELTKRGYRFVRVSELIGSSRDVVNPKIRPADTLMLANDRAVFEGLYLFQLFLGIAFVTAITLGTARVVFATVLALFAAKKEKEETFDETYRPNVSVVIAAYNEEKVIARTIEAVLANDYHPLDIIIVDDGSRDDTSGEVQRRFGEHPNVRLIRQENAGKAAALNHGIVAATGDIIIALDADTIFARDVIPKLVRHFADPLVGAVAGNVKVGNRINPLTYWQAIEYITSQNLDRRAYSVLNAVSVVPGAVGAWRREAILQAGGYTTDTMAEDMDLTWRIRRIGWRIDTDTTALGYTEAPDSIRALFKQRFRWAFGTLQCLWKHRRALGRYGWFGRVMLPSLWLFQIAFQALSPLVDVQIVWSLANAALTWRQAGLTQDWQPTPIALASLYVVATMYLFFFFVELVGAIVAFKLDKEDGKLLGWLFWQRFLYRQLMYAVMLKSMKTALSGIRAGWGKLERKGTVELATE